MIRFYPGRRRIELVRASRVRGKRYREETMCSWILLLLVMRTWEERLSRRQTVGSPAARPWTLPHLLLYASHTCSSLRIVYVGNGSSLTVVVTQSTANTARTRPKMSEHFCCCLPARFGVFVVSLLTLLVSAGTASAILWVLVNGTHSPFTPTVHFPPRVEFGIGTHLALIGPQHGVVLEGGVKTGFIIAGVMYAVSSLFGLFG